MASRGTYGRRVGILRMGWVSSSRPRADASLGFLCMHVVALALPAHLLLVNFAALPEATALDAQNPSPVVTFRGYRFVVE